MLFCYFNLSILLNGEKERENGFNICVDVLLGVIFEVYMFYCKWYNNFGMIICLDLIKLMFWLI